MFYADPHMTPESLTKKCWEKGAWGELMLKDSNMKMLAVPHPGKKVANDHSKTSSGSGTTLLKPQNEQ